MCDKKNSPLPLPCSFTVTASRCVVQLKVRYAHVHKQSQTAHIPVNATCCSGSHVFNTGANTEYGILSLDCATIAVSHATLLSHSPCEVHKTNAVKGAWYMSVLFSLKLITELRLNHIFDLCSKSNVCNFRSYWFFGFYEPPHKFTFIPKRLFLAKIYSMLVWWHKYRVRQWIERFCNTVFFRFGNTGADVAIAIFLPTLKRYSYNGAIDWSTTCFCCESVLQKRWVLWSLSVNFEESSGFIAIVLFHQPMKRPGFETSRLLVLH
jgi:hypothetical protein